MTAITERKVLNLIDTSPTIQRILQKLDEHDARFESIDRRFEEIDRRFEEIDRRFEEIDQKFDLIFNKLDKIITIISQWEDEKIFLSARIEQHDARITFLETDSLKKK